MWCAYIPTAACISVDPALSALLFVVATGGVSSVASDILVLGLLIGGKAPKVLFLPPMGGSDFKPDNGFKTPDLLSVGMSNGLLRLGENSDLLFS